MQLSEAIRLGAMLKPQGFYHLFKDDHTCAFGAALQAIGINTSGDAIAKGSYNIQWPWTTLPGTCPECGLQYGHAPITHLNDEHQWTRERIADFVQTIEPKEDVEPEETESERCTPVVQNA